jgi:uncharacterized SAM-binding protein YcdF (DUF218 family)
MRRLLRFARNALALFGLAFLLITVTPVVQWWARYLAGPWDDPTGDTLIVLGGSVLEDGNIGASSYWRAVYAFRVWSKEQFKSILIAGGGGGVPIASPIRDFLVFRGVPSEVLRVETKSASTHENALNVAQALAQEPGRKVLMTSDYHMFRAYRAFRKAGLDVAPRPIPDALKQVGCYSCRWPAFLTLSTESAKIVYYWARGWI